MESDQEYFERRAREEREAADRALTPEAKARHQLLSSKFYEMALKARAEPSEE